MKLSFLSHDNMKFPFKVKNNFTLSDYYIIGRISEKGCPPAPCNVFNQIPENAEILYDIFSADCMLSSKGDFSVRKLSEEQALKTHPSSPLYSDSFSNTGYKRYEKDNIQHTVWIEDAYHVAKKLLILEKSGFNKVNMLVTEISYPTILSLIRTNRYSI